MMRHLILALVGALFGLTFAAPAWACPDGQAEDSFGICWPTIGGDVGRTFEHLKGEVRGQVVGEPLAIWLQQSHDATERGGTSFVPPQIKQALAGYIPDDILNSARFVIGDAGAFNAAHVIEHMNGEVTAVTLIDIIVFKNQWDAFNNPALWAHELTHVKQYRAWGGVRNFAISYTRDYNQVENEAYGVERGYAAFAAQRFAPWPGAQPMPQRVGVVCSAPPVWCNLPPMPVGSQCTCTGPNGVFTGIVQ